jgi:hypothetical protein
MREHDLRLKILRCDVREGGSNGKLTGSMLG